jgi:hypothetical protein
LSWQRALLSWQRALLSWQRALLSWQRALLSWQRLVYGRMGLGLQGQAADGSRVRSRA